MTNGFWQKELGKIRKQIIEKYKPEKIILFGSFSSGNYDEGSDFDFFIIKKSSLPRRFRTSAIYRILNNYQIPVDPLVYTPEEVSQRVKLGDFFIKRILKEGKVLYEKK